jgi:hypothetical protein
MVAVEADFKPPSVSLKLKLKLETGFLDPRAIPARV